MGRLGKNPSSRGYATPTYATTPVTARETFGGTSKAGLGRHIGMGQFTYGAIVNASSGHQASFLAGNSFPAAFQAGRLLNKQYPISDTNQLARIGTGTTGGMTRTPADGVNTKQRENMQERVDKWNEIWPSLPIRDTPNSCCKTIPHLNQDENHTDTTANELVYGQGLNTLDTISNFMNINWASITSSSDGMTLAAASAGTFGIEQGSIWVSIDGGNQWTNVTTSQTQPNEQPWTIITMSSDGTKLFAGSPGGAGLSTNIWRSSDPFTDWTELTITGQEAAPWLITSSDNGDTLFAASAPLGESGGKIWKSVDSGNNWTESNSNNQPWSSITSSSNGRKVYATVSGGNIWRSSDSGNNWTEDTSVSSTKNWSSITSSSDGTKVYACGWIGSLWTSSDSGNNWREVAGTERKNWSSITSSSSGEIVYACVNGGSIWKSQDSGNNWTGVIGTAERNWYSITSSDDGTKVTVVEQAGNIWRSSDSGNSWTEIINPNN